MLGYCGCGVAAAVVGLVAFLGWAWLVSVCVSWLIVLILRVLLFLVWFV